MNGLGKVTLTIKEIRINELIWACRRYELISLGVPWLASSQRSSPYLCAIWNLGNSVCIFHQKIYFQLWFGNDSSSDSAFRLVFLSVDFLFMLPLLIQIFEVLVEQYKIMVSNNRQEGFRGVLQLLALSASVFRFDGRGVLFAQMLWIAAQHPQRPFLSFLQTLPVLHCAPWACRSPGNGRARISSPQ